MPGKRPAVWGPFVWRWIHVMGKRWDESGPHESAEPLVAAMASLMGVLPCDACRTSYAEFFACLRPGLRLMAEDGDAEHFMFLLHSVVSAKLGKPPVRYEDVRVGKHGTGAHDPLWPMAFALALNYDDNGEPNRCAKYRKHLTALGELYAELGDARMAEVLRSAGENVAGRQCTETVAAIVMKARVSAH